MKLSFHGGADSVTGSCVLVETDRGQLLIDCGMFQGERICGSRNFGDFGFDPKKISAVLVTHAHIDHTGRLPLLIRRGFTGKVYATAPTLALMRPTLEDTHHVMTENATRCGDPVLYEEGDLALLEAHKQEKNYHESFEPILGVTAMFHDAGHILGSAYASLDIGGERLIFSGDIGNDDVPILAGTEALERADVVVCESTYGNRDHKPIEGRTQKLREVVTRVMRRDGTLLIPSFSVERTQELLYELDQLFEAGSLPNVPIFLDSPLSIEATRIYRNFKQYLRFDRSILKSSDADFFSFPRLHETITVEQSKAINDMPSPKIIIAGSGMMTGGRVLHHLKRVLPGKRNAVLIIGYQARGTLGAQIAEGAKRVNVYNQPTAVNCDVEFIHEFSAHGDRGKLARWMSSGPSKPKNVFLVHGDDDAKIDFKKYLEEKGFADVVIPKMHEVFEL